MSKIYKINVVNKNNEIKNIFVFHGTAPYNKTDAKEILIPKFIHSDDTIGKIKEKYEVQIEEVEIVKENVFFKIPGMLN